MAQFKKRVFGENVSADVINEFRKLANEKISVSGMFDTAGMDEFGAMSANLMEDIFAGPGGVLEPQEPTFENYLGDRTPFTRMWCAVNINTLDAIPPNGEIVERHEEGYYYYIPKDSPLPPEQVEVGHDKNSHTRVFVVNENTEESHVNNSPLESLQVDGTKSLQQITQLQHNPLMKPSAGITSVTSKTQGALGALRNTTVEFVVHNKHDFENIFLPYFLKPGSIVCVDYGWSDIVDSLYNPIDQIKDKPLDMSEFDKFIYGEEKGFLSRNYGKVNTAMGNVVSYDANITPEGSYNCSLEIVSRNTSLLDKEISDDNHLRFVFDNAINNILVEVLASVAKTGTPLSLEQINENISVIDETKNQEILEQFFGFITEERQLGAISEFSLKTGIFHQSMKYHVYDAKNKVLHPKSMGKQEEQTYISYGLFEDLFLTNFVAGTIPTDSTVGQSVDKKTISFKENPSKDFTNRFDSRTTYIRWDEDLSSLARQELETNEALSAFIIPENWDESYNSNKLGDEFVLTDDCIGGNHPDYPGIAVMPLRDVFIKVPLISEAFRKKSTVNDVIIFILDTLNLESNKVWNLKISSDMTSQARVSITDTNLNPQTAEERDMLVFNVMGETSIVSQCDLKFTTPKAGLSSMIAIGNLHGPQRFEQLDLSALNNLNLLNRPEEKANLPTIVKSLPLQGVQNKQMTNPAANIDFSNFVKSNNIELENSMIADIKSRYDVYQKNTQSLIDQAVATSGLKEKKKEFKKHESDATLVSSIRSLIKERLRTTYYDASGLGTIAPILPIELTLSVYGNNFLQIGDYYTVNYLPSYYRNKVFFQIAGIEDTIDVNGWTTTYNPSIMRIRSDKKELITGNVKTKEILINSEAKPLGDIAVNHLQRASGIISKFSYDYASVVDNYTDGVDKYKLTTVESPYLNFNAYAHIIKPQNQWEPVDEEAGGKPELAIFHASIASEINITEIFNLSYASALRDVILGKDLTPFKTDKIVYAKPVSEVLSSEETVMIKNTDSIVFSPVLSQETVVNESTVLTGGEFSEEEEGKIADAISSLSPKKGEGYYVISDEDMFATSEVSSYWFATDKEITLPLFVSKYFFPISLDNDFAFERQKLYELQVRGPSVFNKIYLPEHLFRKEHHVNTFISNLRERFNYYYSELNQWKIEREVKGITTRKID